MKENEIYSELSSIRNLMERSTKFFSLSGLSGILAGIYAMIGAILGYRMVYAPNSGMRFKDMDVIDPTVWLPLFVIALAVLVLSIVTGVLLTVKQASRHGESIWNPVSKRLVTSFSIPLVVGGLFILTLIYRGEYGTICALCLIFYGLALVSASSYTFAHLKWFGYCEIALGLIAALMPGYGIVLWIIGFSLLHIIYGTIMHFKYNR